MTLNWREAKPNIAYPHYGPLRKRFRQLLKRLTDALDELGQPHAVTLAEVTYVNPIDYPGARTSDHISWTHPDPANIINRLKKRPSGAFLPKAQRTPSYRLGGVSLRALSAETETLQRDVYIFRCCPV